MANVQQRQLRTVNMVNTTTQVIYPSTNYYTTHLYRTLQGATIPKGTSPRAQYIDL